MATNCTIPINERDVHVNQERGTVQCKKLITEELDSPDGTITINGNIAIPVDPVNIGDEGSLAYNSTSQSLMYSNGNAWRGAGSNLAESILVYQPGYALQSSQNVFSDWNDLYTTLQTIPGSKFILFSDESLPYGDPIIIPPGNWDMTNTTWRGNLYNIHTPDLVFTQINISDGATVNGLGEIDGPILVTYFGTTTPAITVNTIPFSRAAALVVGGGARIACLGTQPFIEVTDGFYEIITVFGSQIYGIPAVPPPPFEPYSTVQPLSAINGSTLIIVISPGCFINDNSLSGDAFTFFIRLAPGAVITIPLAQPAFSGTYAISSVYTSPDTYQRTVNPTPADDDTVGYKIGDQWVNTLTNRTYTCVNNFTAFAIWNVIMTPITMTLNDYFSSPLDLTPGLVYTITGVNKVKYPDSITGSIANNILTVTAATFNNISCGMYVVGAGVPANTYINGFISGTYGGIGLYSITPNNGPLTIASQPMTIEPIDFIYGSNRGELYDDGTNSGITIFLTAVSSTEFSKMGTGVFYNPKYLVNTVGNGVWNLNMIPAPTIGSKVIWGGYSWTNISGNVGTSNEARILSPSDWTKDEYDTTNYVLAYDEIAYDFNTDLITMRFDKANNISVSITPESLLQYYYYCNPIYMMCWGMNQDLLNYRGIYNILVESSECGIINFTGKSFNNARLNSSSSVNGLTNANIYDGVICDYSNNVFYDFNLTNSGLFRLYAKASSFIHTINFTNLGFLFTDFDNSKMRYCLVNNSGIVITSTNNSDITNCIFNNNPELYMITDGAKGINSTNFNNITVPQINPITYVGPSTIIFSDFLPNVTKNVFNGQIGAVVQYYDGANLSVVNSIYV
jgi:hypothetical protein